MSKKPLSISESAAVQMPMKTVASLIVIVALGTMGYFQIVERINIADTKIKIMEQDVGSGGGGSAPTAQAPAPQMLSGAFDLSGVQAPEPVQAFVVTDDMTNSQDKLATIRRRATI